MHKVQPVSKSACLQVGNLRWLAKHTRLPLIQLLDPAQDICWDTKQTYGAMMTDAGLDAIAQYTSGVGLDKQDLLKGEQPGWPAGATELAAAHESAWQDGLAELVYLSSSKYAACGRLASVLCGRSKDGRPGGSRPKGCMPALQERQAV